MKYHDIPMKANNAIVYNFAVAMELTILDCEKMGLTVEKVEFDGHFRPRIFVRNCENAQKLLALGIAKPYGSVAKNGVRYDLIQMPNRECKILWQADRLH